MKSRDLTCPDAWRIQPWISTPLITAASTSRPLAPIVSASASTGAKAGDNACVAGVHIGSKSSTCIDVALSSAAGTAARRNPKPSADDFSLRSLRAQIVGHDTRRRLDARAGHRDADAVEDELPRLGDRILADAVRRDGDDLVAESTGHARYCFSHLSEPAWNMPLKNECLLTAPPQPAFILPTA